MELNRKTGRAPMTKNSRSDTRTAAVRLEQRQVGDKGEFEGYGSVFGVEDSYGEIVSQGAFAQSLADHRKTGTLPALLWQHDPHKPIGTYTEMREDEKGLYVKGQLALDTQLGKEAHALLKCGALNGLSIGFMPVKWEYDEETQIRTLTEIDLWECSLVTFPANTAARVSGTKAIENISSLTSWKDVEEYLRDEGGFSNGAATAIVGAVKRIRDAERDARGEKANLKASADRLLEIMKS